MKKALLQQLFWHCCDMLQNIAKPLLRLSFVMSLTVFIFVNAPLLVSAPANAQDKATKVKAVFLFKFFDYVTWPEAKDPKVTGRGVVCTLGPHPFGQALRYIADRKSASAGGGVRYYVRSINNISKAKGCHVLYVSRSYYGQMRRVAGLNVLTVADREGFLGRGGVLEIGDGGASFKLSIDLDNAAVQELNISSQLLKLSRVKR